MDIVIDDDAFARIFNFQAGLHCYGALTAKSELGNNNQHVSLCEHFSPITTTGFFFSNLFSKFKCHDNVLSQFIRQ